MACILTTINSLINSMRWRFIVVVTPDTDWFSDPCPYLGICDHQMHICIPSHVKAIDEGLMNSFQLADFLIWTVTQINSLKFLHVALIFLISVVGTQSLSPKWNTIPSLVQYFFLPGPIRLCSEVVHYIANRVSFGTEMYCGPDRGRVRHHGYAASSLSQGSSPDLGVKSRAGKLTIAL